MKTFDIEQAKQAAERIAKKYDLKLVALFGSQATGKTHEKSDIDIAVLGKQAVDFDVQTKIWSEFSDVFKRDDIEVVVLNGASPTMMYVLVRDGKLLYEKAAGDFMSWKFYALGVWRDTAWLRDLNNRKLHKWADAQRI